MAKQAEEAKIQCEMAKLNGTPDRKGKIQQFINPDSKQKLEARSQMLLKEAKETERVYINSLNNANNSREIYIESMKIKLNEFQELEEKLIEEIKNALRKYVVFQVSLFRNFQYDVEKKASVTKYIKIYYK